MLFNHSSLQDKIKKSFFLLQWLSRQPPEEQVPALIISGCRTVLEFSCNVLNADGDNLYEKLNDLIQKRILTMIFADWIQELREMSNIAVHELEGTTEEVEKHIIFLKYFLKFTFELPHEIKKAKLKFSSS